MKDSLLRLAVQADIKNPLDGISPTFDFGAAFNTWWKGLVAAAWGIALIVVVVFIIKGVVTLATAGENPARHTDGKHQLRNAAIAFGLLAGLSIWVGAILNVAG